MTFAPPSPGSLALACDYAVRTIHCQRQMHVLVQDIAACRAKSQVIQSDPVGGCAHPGLLSSAPAGAEQAVPRLASEVRLSRPPPAEQSAPEGPERIAGGEQCEPPDGGPTNQRALEGRKKPGRRLRAEIPADPQLWLSSTTRPSRIITRRRAYCMTMLS